MVTRVRIVGDPHLKKYQLANCPDCRFADKKKVGSGTPCCTFPGKLESWNGKCLTRR